MIPGTSRYAGELAASRGYILWLMGNGAEGLQHRTWLSSGFPWSTWTSGAMPSSSSRWRIRWWAGRSRASAFWTTCWRIPTRCKRSARPGGWRVACSFTSRPATCSRPRWRTGDCRQPSSAGVSAYVRAWTDYLAGGDSPAPRRVGRRRSSTWSDPSRSGSSITARAAVDSITGLMLAYQALGQKDEARETTADSRGAMSRPWVIPPWRVW